MTLTRKQRLVLSELPDDGSWWIASRGSEGLGAARTQLVARGLVERDGYGSHMCRITKKGREALAATDGESEKDDENGLRERVATLEAVVVKLVAILMA